MNNDEKNSTGLLRAAAIAAGVVLMLALLLAAAQVTPGKRIKDYPHTNQAPDTAVFIMEHTNRPGPGPTETNLHISALELFQQGSNNLAGISLVTLTSNGLAAVDLVVSNALFTTINAVSNFLATSSVKVATNQTMMVLQQAPFSGSQWFVGSNSVPVTNEARAGLEFNAFWRSLRMGEVAAGSDIYGLVGNGSNYWNNTNIGPLSVGFGSNASVKAAYSSVLGGIYNAILTNAKSSVIAGGADNLIDTNALSCVIGGGGRNAIRTQDTGNPATASIGNSTIAGGSNNVIGGVALNSRWSTIGGGGDNLIKVEEATIAGGFGNTIQQDGRNGFIGGGNNNQVGVNGGSASASLSSVVSGGGQNRAEGTYSSVGGGFQNQMFVGDDYCTIGGGQLNIIGVTPNNFSTHATISGGSSGLIEQNSHWSVIGGGLRNIIRSGSTNSTISGGEDNEVQANAPFGSILGGRDNTITSTGDYGTIAGFSNQVSAPYAMAFGLTVSNGTANSVMASEFISYNTPAVIAGAGSGSTNYLLAVTSPKMLLGSSNVNIYGVSGTIAGKTHNWSVNITNLSADTWGISFASGTNRWKFQSYMYGTSAPVVLTNNTLLRLTGESEGTNTLVTYEYFRPAL